MKINCQNNKQKYISIIKELPAVWSNKGVGQGHGNGWGWGGCDGCGLGNGMGNGASANYGIGPILYTATLIRY